MAKPQLRRSFRIRIGFRATSNTSNSLRFVISHQAAPLGIFNSALISSKDGNGRRKCAAEMHKFGTIIIETRGNCSEQFSTGYNSIRDRGVFPARGDGADIKYGISTCRWNLNWDFALVFGNLFLLVERYGVNSE